MPHVQKEMISFFLTTRCNLRCIYCYNVNERERDYNTISLDFAKAGIDYFFSHFQSRHIRFYGPGEPTQAFDTMVAIHEYANRLAGDLLTAEIQSNGIFNDKVCNWLGENIDIIWISFDGTPSIQNFNRPTQLNTPSAPIIEKNVRMLEKMNKPFVGARVTITDKNLYRQIEMIDYFMSLGIKYIWTDPLFSSVEEKAVNKKTDINRQNNIDIDSYVNEYIKAISYAKKKGAFWGSFLTCNFDGSSKYNCRACIPVPHLTSDGYVSACDLVTSGGRPYHMNPFVYGKWDEATRSIVFYEDKINKLRSRSVDNMPACKGCVASEHCAGYCLGEVTNETGSLFGQIPHICEAVIKLYNNIGTTASPYKYLHP